MLDRDRFRLLGKYTTPRVKVGTVLSCEGRDRDVVVTAYTDGPIPWPIGRLKHGKGRHGPILFGDLAKAVRLESNQAVAHWFGLHPRSVSRLRKALGIRPMNAGTEELRKAHGKEDWFAAARQKAHSAGWTEERRQRMAERFEDQRRPPHVIEAMRKGRTGKPHPLDVRIRICAARRKRAADAAATSAEAWTPKHDRIVRSHPPKIAARLTRRSLGSVYHRRTRLGLTDKSTAKDRKSS
jgi:hypothetical protein